jgi:hypothetical protein
MYSFLILYYNRFISDDGGRTWRLLASGPHLYESLDSGSILVLIPDSGPTNQILVSVDRGKTLATKTLTITSTQPLSKWRAKLTSMDADGTSSTMLLFVTEPTDETNLSLMALDMSGLLTRKCGNEDFELYRPSGLNDGGESTCVLGLEVDMYRRKAESDCYVGKKYEGPKTTLKRCSCTRDDYECDMNFIQNPKVNRLECIPLGKFRMDEPAECVIGKTFKGSSGYRRIPGDVCEGGEALDNYVDVPCTGKASIDKKPKVTVKHFDETLVHMKYAHNSGSIFALGQTTKKVWRSMDEGATWDNPSALSSLTHVDLFGFHEKISKTIYFFGLDTIVISRDLLQSSSLESLNLPKDDNGEHVPYNTLGVPILDFHPSESEYLVYAGGGRGCPSVKTCFSQIYLTIDHGKSWLNNGKPVETWATKCVWAWDASFGSGSKLSKDAVLCTSYKNKNGDISQDELDDFGGLINPIQLVLIFNKGTSRKVLIDKGVVQFYVVDSHLVVAVVSFFCVLYMKVLMIYFLIGIVR